MIKIVKTISPIEIKVSFDPEDRSAFIAGQSVPNVYGWMTESVSSDVNEAILRLSHYWGSTFTHPDEWVCSGHLFGRVLEICK